jgi:hypothetical protein
VKAHSSSTPDLHKKIISPEKAIVLHPVLDSDRHEMLSVQLETVHLNGICTADLIKTLADTVHELSEDVAFLENENASLKSKINKLLEKSGQSLGSSSCCFGLQANTKISDSTKAPLRRILPGVSFRASESSP